MPAKTAKDRVLEIIKELEDLQKEKDKKIAELEEGNERLQGEFDELAEKYDKLIEELKALTAGGSLPVGQFITLVPGKDNRILINDNHKRLWEVIIGPAVKQEELVEGADAYYLTAEGQILSVFAVHRSRRNEEIVLIKEVIDKDTALIVLPGDVMKLANIGQKVKQGKLEEGDKVFYDSGVNFITEKIEKTKEKVDASRKKIAEVKYSDVGGLAEQIRQIKEVVELPLMHPEVFEKLGIKPQKGILLTGPPGCGKTLLGRAVAGECDAFFIHVGGPEIKSPYVGESEARVRAVFDTARRNAPSIIFFDELEAWAIKREGAEHQHEISLVSQLLTLMDGVDVLEKVIVIAATNAPNLLDPALRRPGRFDKEIRIDVPTRDGRLEILKIHSKAMTLAADVKLEDLADRTHGFTGADLENLCKEAGLRLLRDWDLSKLDKLPEKIEVPLENFHAVLEQMKPSIMREVVFQKPFETWDDVGGLEEVKTRLIEAVKWPLLYPELLKVAGQKPIKGIMLFGPPGCGKTLLAKALVNECGANYLPVKGPELLEKFVGDSEKGVRTLFDRARQAAPCVIFFDEVEALAPRRGAGITDSGVGNKVTSQILSELDGISEIKGVFVLAATNRLDLVDPALMRSGRLKPFYIPPPDKEAREKIFAIHTKKRPLAEDVDIRVLASMAALPAGTPIPVMFEGQWAEDTLKDELPFSGADIEDLCREATQIALREFVLNHDPRKDYKEFKVEMRHFMAALEKILSSVKTAAKDAEALIKKEEKKPIKELTDKDLADIV